MVMRHQIQTT